MPAGLRTRRSLLPILAGLALPVEAFAQVASPWIAGLQLWTVRDQLGADRDGTLRRIAETGYRTVELPGLSGVTVRDMQASLQRFGLKAPSLHAGYEELARKLDPAIEDARVLGAECLVCPSINADKRVTSDDWKRVCEFLSRAGRALRSHGLLLAYHNHDFEFVPLADGAIPFDLMLTETDPRDVKLELDVYWLAKAGRDPVQSLEDNQGRVVLVHLKDLGADGETVELGAGVLPLEQIIRTALSIGVKHLFVEQDNSPDPIASVRTSFQFLERLPRDVRPQ
jgi:sugar phosphate isomerase/epimerase